MAEQDIVDRLTADHTEIRSLFAQLDTTAPEDRGDLFRHIVSELARHEAAEEAVVHSATRDDVPGGEEIADAVLAEEDQAEKLMAEMERMDPTSEEFLTRFRHLRDDVLAHAEHEEADEFPRLRQHLDADRRRRMADGFERLKGVAPTHPHPHTPQEPGVRAVAGPIAGVFDRARDAARNVFSS
jgi:hemerythrin superfamily protein